MKDLVVLKLRKTMTIHDVGCKWIFRLGQCTCYGPHQKVTNQPILGKGKIVFGYDEPIPAGWSSIGWWIVIDGKLCLLPSQVGVSLNDTFEVLEEMPVETVANEGRRHGIPLPLKP